MSVNKLNIDIIQNEFNIDFESEIKDFCCKLYSMFEFENTAFLTILFCNSLDVTNINKKYRNKNSDTDVLSFEYYDNLAKNKSLYENQILNLGDIIISYDYAKKQAKSLNNDFKKEVIFLICHGFLHLLGYDHLTKDQEFEMLTLQKKIMGDYHQKLT